MSNLVFHIRGQALTVEPIEDVLVENSVNFLTATFILDKTEKNREWLGLSTIRVEFLHNNKPYREEISFTELGGVSEKVTIPWEAIQCPGFSVSVSGLLYRNNTREVVKRIPTGVVPIPLKQSGSLGGLVSSEFGTETDFVLALQKLEEKVSHNDKEMDELQKDFDELEALVKGSEKINIGVNLLKNSQLIHHYSNMPELPLKETQLFDEEEEFYFYRYTFDYSKKPQADAEKNLLSLYNTIPLSNLTTPFKASADTRPDTDNEKNIYTLSFWARAKKEGESILFAWIKDKDIDKDPLEGINGTPSHNSRIILKDKWTRYHITIKLDRDYDTDTGILFFCPSDVWEYVGQGETRDPNYYIDLCNWKIEKGDKPTNWSSSLEKYEKQMVEIQTAFIQTGEKILAEVDGKVENVDGKVSEVENKLTVDIEGVKTTSEEKIDGLTKSYSELKVTADKISSIVADGDYGVNLLKGSGLKNQEDYSEWWDDLSGECFVAPYDENGKEIEWSHSIIKSGVSVNTGQFLPKNVIKPDSYYVLSFNIKIETPGNSNNKGNPRITMMERGQKVINSTPSWEKVGEGTDRVIYLNEKRDWTRYSMIVRYPKDKLEEYQNNENYNLAVILEFTNLSDAVVYIKEAKFEEGVTPTDWAPGDDKKYESMITQASDRITQTVKEKTDGYDARFSEIEQTASDISTSVVNVEEKLSSSIKQTADSITHSIVGANLLKNSSFDRETFLAPDPDNPGEKRQGRSPLHWWAQYPADITGGYAKISIPLSEYPDPVYDEETGKDIAIYTQMFGQDISNSFLSEKTYVVSAKFLVQESLTEEQKENAMVGIEVSWTNDEGNWAGFVKLLPSLEEKLGWETLELTFTTPAKSTINWDAQDSPQVIVFGRNLPAGAKIYVKEIQLEFGSVATPWQENTMNYMTLTKDGFFVGDYDAQKDNNNVKFAGPNVKLGTDDSGNAVVEIRDSDIKYAWFDKTGAYFKTNNTNQFKIGNESLPYVIYDWDLSSFPPTLTPVIKYMDYNVISSDSLLSINAQTMLRLSATEEKEDGTTKDYGLSLESGKISYFKMDSIGTGTENGESSALHYTEGDSISVLWVGAGYITNSKSHIHFCIPLSKIIPFSNKVKDKIKCECTYNGEDGGIIIRQDGSYKYGCAPAQTVDEVNYGRLLLKPSEIEVSLDNDSNFLRVYAKFNEVVSTEDYFTSIEKGWIDGFKGMEGNIDSSLYKHYKNFFFKVDEQGAITGYKRNIDPINNDACGIEARLTFTFGGIEE